MSAAALILPISLISALLLLVAALHDLAVRTVPNVIPALLLAAGLVLRAQDATLLAGLAAMLCVFVATTICWLRGWMGGGDVKLYAACSLLLAPAQVLPFVLASALFGGVLALVYLSLRAVTPKRANGMRPRSLAARMLRCERRRIRRGGPLPYAAAIALGAIFTLAAA